jgi:hypothetical protein
VVERVHAKHEVIDSKPITRSSYPKKSMLFSISPTVRLRFLMRVYRNAVRKWV